jgi:UDP-glucose 4-epimerase
MGTSRSHESDAMITSLLVTGSAGFIGSHLSTTIADALGTGCRMFGIDAAPSPCSFPGVAWQLDIRDRPPPVAAIGKVSHVMHLAAVAEVEVPFNALEELTATNVMGTIALLEATSAERFIFASSSAVYGNAGDTPVRPGERSLAPVGAYGASKLLAEFAVREWASMSAASAFTLRLGNVVGTGCRGLVRYLVRHALLHPEGNVPARCRGGGRIVRDYVPVDHVTRCMLGTLRAPADSSEYIVLNVGSGRPCTNGQIAEIVVRVLRESGFRLQIDWEHPPLPGEASAVVLDVEETTRRLGLGAPGFDEVVAAVEAATRDYLGHGTPSVRCEYPMTSA